MQFQNFCQVLGPPGPVTRNIYIFLGRDSVNNPFDKVKGDLKTSPRTHYKRSTAADNMGPASLPGSNAEEAKCDMVCQRQPSQL